MDTLHVSPQNQQSNSRNISRSASPCRADQSMPADRNTTTDASSSVRFRHQSPSTNRKSREREKLEKDKESAAITQTNRDREMIADQVDSYDDSRLLGNDDLGCSTSYNFDDYDGVQGTSNTSQNEGSEPRTARTRTNSCQVLDRLSTKIACTKESIRKEQTARDDNVNEYLKLAASADKQQLQRIKAVFEKKNQKSAHNISQLQKKLESYNKRLKDLQLQQSMKLQIHRQPREMLRDVGQGLRNVGGNIRDGVTTVMSKPREFAHLIKNKFGSADNINQISSTWYTDPELNELNLNSSSHPMDATTNSTNATHHHHHGAMTPNNSGTMTSVGSSGNAAHPNITGGGSSGKFNSEQESECSSVTSESMPGGSGKNQPLILPANCKLTSIITELFERKEDCEKLKEKVARLETQQKEITDLALALESERYRAERLEEQINDLTELHQNEIENLKQTMADMEEKVQYQSDERLRDVNDVLENCQTRISKMEHLSQQQFTNLSDGIDNGRELVVKLINVVLTVLQVILLVVATAAGIIMPFLKTRIRVLTTIITILFIILIIRQWPDVRDIGSSIGSHVVRHLKETLLVK